MYALSAKHCRPRSSSMKKTILNWCDRLFTIGMSNLKASIQQATRSISYEVNSLLNHVSSTTILAKSRRDTVKTTASRVKTRGRGTKGAGNHGGDECKSRKASCSKMITSTEVEKSITVLSTSYSEQY